VVVVKGVGIESSRVTAPSTILVSSRSIGAVAIRACRPSGTATMKAELLLLIVSARAVVISFVAYASIPCLVRVEWAKPAPALLVSASLGALVAGSSETAELVAEPATDTARCRRGHAVGRLLIIAREWIVRRQSRWWEPESACAQLGEDDPAYSSHNKQDKEDNEEDTGGMHCDDLRTSASARMFVGPLRPERPRMVMLSVTLLLFAGAGALGRLCTKASDFPASRLRHLDAEDEVVRDQGC